MSQQEDVHRAIKKAKDSGLALDVHDETGALVCTMKVAGRTQEEATRVADWREQARDWSPTVFPYNPAVTLKWLENQVYSNPERILFFLYTPEGDCFGHVGLATFHWEPTVSCELDGIMRGKQDIKKGAMFHAVQRLIAWAVNDLHMPKIALRVFADNDRAIRLYERLGFTKAQVLPLYFEKGDPISMWKDADADHPRERDMLVMERPAVLADF